MILDDGQGVFTPLTDLRAVFELRTGMHTTLKRIEHITGMLATAFNVPQPLAEVVAARYPDVRVNQAPTAGNWLIVNGRCADVALLARAAALTPGQTLCLADQTLVAACVSLTDTWDLPGHLMHSTVEDAALLTRVWQIHELLHANLLVDIAQSPIPPIDQLPGVTVQMLPGVTIFGEYPIKVHPTAVVQPGVIFNATAGPIVIKEQAMVESPAVIQGPCAICQGAMIAPMTQLRNDTVIGPVCKVGGEIKTSIIAGYSNKAHAGYLGNALVGYWVNLGADTTASNLKNTYSPVRMQLAPHLERENTGLANLGPVIGDYVRTGIATHMPTGTVIGTGTMIAQSTLINTCIPAMRFISDKGDQPYDPAKLIDTVIAMMARRDQQLTKAEAARLNVLANTSDA